MQPKGGAVQTEGRVKKAARVSPSGLVCPTLGYPARGSGSWLLAFGSTDGGRRRCGFE